MHVLGLSDYSGEILERLTRHLPEGWVLTGLEDRDDQEEKQQKLTEADFLLVSDLPLTEKDIESARRLKLVHKKGVGYESIDLDALRRRDIPLCICPEGTSESVAEHTIMLMLAVRSNLLRIDADVRSGSWPKWRYRADRIGLRSSRVGLVGFGRIGQEVARRLRVFGATVTAYVRSPEQAAKQFPDVDVTFVDDLTELARMVDVLSIHVPLTPQTRHLIDASIISRLTSRAIIVNTSRGGVIDQDALCEALHHGRIAGAGLDVVTPEPPRMDDPLMSLDNVILSGHTAGGGLDVFDIKGPVIFGNMVAALNGQPLQHRIV